MALKPGVINCLTGFISSSLFMDSRSVLAASRSKVAFCVCRGILLFLHEALERVESTDQGVRASCELERAGTDADKSCLITVPW